MTEYLARFTGQAEVTIELRITADNQQDALVAAHDMVSGAVSNARVVRIVPGSTLNTALETLQSVPAPATTANSQQFEAIVETFEELHLKGKQLSRTPVASLAQARRLLQASVFEAPYVAGSARLLDKAGVEIFTANADRGGWEVSVRLRDVANAQEHLLNTWLPGRLEASRIAVAAGASNPGRVISVTDFSCRSKGPVLWKEIGGQDSSA